MSRGTIQVEKQRTMIDDVDSMQRWGENRFVDKLKLWERKLKALHLFDSELH